MDNNSVWEKRSDKCVCGWHEATILFRAGQFFVVECTRCKLVRVVGTQGAKRKQFYSKEDIKVYIEKEQMFRQLFNNVIMFIKNYKEGGRLLDIGAGVGLFVDEARQNGFDADGIEPSRSAVAAARKYFGVTLKQGIFIRSKIRNKYDVVVINHVLEHLKNPVKLVTDIKSVIRLSGLLVVGVPNFASIMSILKRQRWQSLVPDQHKWLFTIRTLDNLVIPVGFKRIGYKSENHDRSMHAWWKKPIYRFLDQLALMSNQGEAILVAYKKV